MQESAQTSYEKATFYISIQPFGDKPYEIPETSFVNYGLGV